MADRQVDSGLVELFLNHIEAYGCADIVVKLRAGSTRVFGYSEDDCTFTLAVKAVPEKGEANMEILKYLSRITKREAKIVKGATSRRKSIRFL